MMEHQHDESRWVAYYKALEGCPPHPLFVNALACFATISMPRFAVDLGCGAGIETLALLQSGWHVLAIDKEPDAIDILESGVPDECRSRLETRVAPFEGLSLPSADLIYAGYSLPFCDPKYFDSVWTTIVSAIRPGGRFAGQLFGERDSWSGNPKMTFHTIDQARGLLDGFDVEWFREVDEDGRAVSGPKHWHLFEIVARKPGA